MDDDSRHYNVYLPGEILGEMLYKGIALDGVHVGTTTGMKVEASSEGTARFTVEFVLDERGVENLIDYMKMMKVMR